MTTVQHYVPNFILKNFASPTKELWILNKKNGKCWSRKGGRRNRYEGFAENSYLPTDVDDALGRLECKAALIIRTILNDVRIGSLPRLSVKEKEDLCHFLYTQFFRVPRVKGFGEKRDPQVYFSMLKETPVGMPDPEFPERELFEWMNSLNLSYALVEPSANVPLLVCDEPCLHSDERVVMRIAKDVVIELSEGSGCVTGVDLIDSIGVRELNRETMELATEFVAGPTFDALCIH